jgi:hypothetical protein
MSQQEQPPEGKVDPKAVPDSAKGRISELLERSKPYREIIAIGVAAITALSGGVAWAVAHFATEAEVFYLECRMNNNIVTQALPLQTGVYTAEIDWRTSQIKQIAQLNASAAANTAIAQLSAEINELTKQQTALTTEFQKKIEEMSKRCSAEAPARSDSN